MGKLLKCAGLERQDSAVGFLRVVQVMRFLKREGRCAETRILPFTGDYQTQRFQWNDKVLMEVARNADVFLTDMLYRDDDFLRMLNLRQWSGAKWVVDIDDNIFAVVPDNPNYQGVHAALPQMQRTLSWCDGVTVSVPSLAKLYSALNPQVFVQPNGVDLAWWNQFKGKPHPGLRLGWRGGAGHARDFALILPAVRAICRDYPGTKLVVFQELDPLLDFPYEWQPFVPYFGRENPEVKGGHNPDYPAVLAALNIDIGLVPLTDNGYNRAKSNLAWQEFASLGIPTILSPVANQRNLPARYANTNWEWYQALAELLADTDIRRALGAEAKAQIKTHYDMRQLIHPLADWFEALPRRTDVTPELARQAGKHPVV